MVRSWELSRVWIIGGSSSSMCAMMLEANGEGTSVHDMPRIWVVITDGKFHM